MVFEAVDGPMVAKIFVCVSIGIIFPLYDILFFYAQTC